MAVVRALFDRADDELDYCEFKLAIDRLIDPTIDIAATHARIDRLAADAQALAGPAASPDARFMALRRLLYDAGPWNDHRPFAYDLSDPLGQRLVNKLLANYLATRRGQCASMPALFAILGERLGLDVAFATAPHHMFVRFRDDSGRWINFEATNGHPARDAWYRQQMPMSDRAIASGLYMRTLGKREGAAALASVLLEHLFDERRYVEAIDLARVILEHHSHDAHALLSFGSACAHLLRIEFESKYRFPALIPLEQRPRYHWLAQRNHVAFEAAEALGWEPIA